MGHSTNISNNNNSLEDGIDAIERQIQEAMARLSTTGETFVAHLNGGRTEIANPDAGYNRSHQRGTRGVGDGRRTGADAEVVGNNKTGLPNGAALAARLRASLDSHAALFGQEEEGHTAAGLVNIARPNTFASLDIKTNNIAPHPPACAVAAGGDDGYFAGVGASTISDFNPVQFAAEGMTPAHDAEPEGRMRVYDVPEEIQERVPQSEQRPPPRPMSSSGGSRGSALGSAAAAPKLQPLGGNLLARLAAAPMPEMYSEGSGSCC